MADVLLELPPDEREAFKPPLGPIFTDAEALLAEAGEPIVAVGDVVTYHLERVGHRPAVAVVDERTQRGDVGDEVRAVLRDPDVIVENPPATLTRGLLAALRDALAAGKPTTIMVDGEEDLATLPAVLAAPTGASVVYGQPGEGMVLARVDAEMRAEARRLFDLLDGDQESARAVLGLDV